MLREPVPSAPRGASRTLLEVGLPETCEAMEGLHTCGHTGADRDAGDALPALFGVMEVGNRGLASSRLLRLWREDGGLDRSACAASRLLLRASSIAVGLALGLDGLLGLLGARGTMLDMGLPTWKCNVFRAPSSGLLGPSTADASR